MKYVIGIDLGTSAVKTCLMNEQGQIIDEASCAYKLYQEKPGFSEQKPQDWIDGVMSTIQEIVGRYTGEVADIIGISYSGQMHGLVLLDEAGEVLRPAILWNDTRTTAQCEEIVAKVGKERLLAITKNPALEGFTLPKILWVKEHEPETYAKAKHFVLPKDYVRYVMTGELHMERSDAAGTLLLDIERNDWSTEVAEAVGIDRALCPPLIDATTEVGTLTEAFARATGLSSTTKVYGGGADNACGAVGSGIVTGGKSMVSIGTSGVLLSFEQTPDKNFGGKVHYFHHAVTDAYYTMGVTLSAGHSLKWFKETFAKESSFDELLASTEDIAAGSNGLLFTPYLVGERTPYADSVIRGSFIGIDTAHTHAHFAKAVLEGITFSLRDTLEIFRSSGKDIRDIISIGGGAKNPQWLQMQADIFNANIYQLQNEQGPSIGACMIALVGSGIVASFEEAVEKCVAIGEVFEPIAENVEVYNEIYNVYTQIYAQTKSLNEALQAFR
ncbi:xylulose kinase [Ureibacillus massiliensis 4400831 = CIP 108448 = CCUG 49529]|uniref:Xylulose kinase n=1 Tax=Ureibacillus massiliensis 4400831 = CIP 108448 = CCUG 49529 TaxID=1211035 RepID=A0A0A3IXI4_9BACL|nr:xylulokinase [Ureibacillus massiliensis]KGR89411.1 xylulose kinase [Ureibacillus massiliensis 4400831 = CIP 108448 = CCUG 49529]